MNLAEINPMYILSRPERYSKALVQQAQQVVKDQRKAKKKKEAMQYQPSELSQLIIQIRKCKSGSKKEKELKAAIETITGTEYYL